MSYGWQLICFSRLWSSSDRTLKILSLKHVAFCSTALAQAWCSAGHCAGLVLLELLHHMTPDVAFLFPFIIFLLILIVFFVCLKSLFPQESTWPLLGSGAVWSGILPLLGVQSVSTLQFFTRLLVHCRQEQWSLFFECNTQSPRRSSPHPISGHVLFYCLFKLRLYVIWANPSVDNRLFQLHFYFLCCGGALSCPHLSQEMFITWHCLDRERTKLPSLVFRTLPSSCLIGVLNPEIRLSEKREKLCFSKAGEKRRPQDDDACEVPKINKNTL